MIYIKEKRNIRVNIRFTSTEKEKLDFYASDSNMTISEFVRQAVFDKIRNIINPPSMIVKQTDESMSAPFIQKLYKDFDKKVEKIKKEVTPLIEETNTYKNMATVDEVLKNHNGELKITELMKESGLNGLLYDVLAYMPEKYKIKGNKVVLNE